MEESGVQSGSDGSESDVNIVEQPSFPFQTETFSARDRGIMGVPILIDVREVNMHEAEESRPALRPFGVGEVFLAVGWWFEYVAVRIADGDGGVERGVAAKGIGEELEADMFVPSFFNASFNGGWGEKSDAISLQASPDGWSPVCGVVSGCGDNDSLIGCIDWCMRKVCW